MNILYEDHQLLVLHKPAGLSAESGDLPYPSAEKEALAYLSGQGRKNVYLRCAHRLDRPASGLLLLAKSKSALSNLMQQFEQRSVEKTYLAVTEQPAPAPEGMLEHWLSKDAGGRKSLVHDQPDLGGQAARLHYRILTRTAGRTLWCVKPETGRFHQIRAQLSHLGCPIVGDVLYGGIFWQDYQIQLHAHRMVFVHPRTTEKMIMECPIPDNWGFSGHLEIQC
jgi:23S rRNA pseudouridine1911/1915/1917 synthase